MTDRDPAVEAADRAWDAHDGPFWNGESAQMGAREMAAPIRALHKPAMDTRTAFHPEPGCSCGNGADWRDCPTARLIYTSEELK